MIVVTGAAGMIGSAVIWSLNQSGWDRVVAVDDLKRDDRWKNLRGLRFQDYIQKDSFLKMVEGRSLPDGITAIVHLGACSDTAETDASHLVSNNFEYTKSIASYAVPRGVRFVYASSAATYGDGSRGYLDSDSDLPWLRPLNMYGYSKHLADLWMLRNGLLDRAVGLKYFNVFGPNEYHKADMRSVALKAFLQVGSTGTALLFRSHRPDCADGEQKRDFLYVKDAARITLHFVDHTEPAGIFNVGSGRAESWNQLAIGLFSAMGRPASIRYIDMPPDLRPRYQYYTCADTGKLARSGWCDPPTPLGEALEDYVRSYLDRGGYLESATPENA